MRVGCFVVSAPVLFGRCRVQSLLESGAADTIYQHRVPRSTVFNYFDGRFGVTCSLLVVVTEYAFVNSMYTDLGIAYNSKGLSDRVTDMLGPHMISTWLGSL